MNTLKTKAESKKPIYEIEVNDVFYLYAVGLQWIAISTKPDSQWGELPEWCRVCFAVETPPAQYAVNLKDKPDSWLIHFIHRAIRDKIHEQRKAYESQARNNKQLAKHPDQSRQKRPCLIFREKDGKRLLQVSLTKATMGQLSDRGLLRGYWRKVKA